MSSVRRLSTEQLKHVAWRRGDLTYLLHQGQRDAKRAFNDSDGLVYVVCCSRRYGKSYLACVLALEAALRKPRAQVRYAAQTKDAVRKIVRPIIEQLLLDCPEELRPAFNKHDGVFAFPNGSEIHIAGAERGAAERLRGTATDFAVIDEAGFVDEFNNGEDLENLVSDVLLPQTVTTGGRLLMISTPSRSSAHVFLTKYCLRAEVEGNYLHRTIYDAPHITKDILEKYKAEAGGEESATWQREYLAKVVVDEEIAVIPEFAVAEELIVGETERPEFFDAYVSIDIGYHDLTALLFGYYHFPEARIVVEDELVFLKTNSGAIAAEAKEKESELWGHQEPVTRFIDASQHLVRDLSVDHSYPSGS